MSEKKTYTFPVTFDMTNRIHIRAKENLEQLSRETGLNKKQILLMTLSMLNIEKIVDYFSGIGAGGEFVNLKTEEADADAELAQEKKQVYDSADRTVQQTQEKAAEEIVEKTEKLFSVETDNLENEMSEEMQANLIEMFS